MEVVPVLRPVERLAVVLLLIETLDGPAGEEGLRLAAAHRGAVLPGGPGVAVAEQLAGEPATGPDRGPDPSPHLGETAGVAEEQAVARPNKVGRGKEHFLHRHDPGVEPSPRTRSGPKTFDRLGFRIDSKHRPPTIEHRDGVDPRAAPEVDRPPGHGEPAQYLHELVPGSAPFVGLVVVRPG